jgi:hypothetical protein
MTDDNSNLHEALRAIVEPHLNAPALPELRSTDIEPYLRNRRQPYHQLVVEAATARLARAAQDALAAVNAETSPPSTASLLDEALGPPPVVRAGVNGADLEYLARSHLLRRLPKQILRAFLVARSQEHGAQLAPATRELLNEHLEVWLRSHDLHKLGLELSYERRESGSDDYPLGYRSPREKELDVIMYDAGRSQAKREAAADELAAIEWSASRTRSRSLGRFPTSSDGDRCRPAAREGAARRTSSTLAARAGSIASAAVPAAIRAGYGRRRRAGTTGLLAPRGMSQESSRCRSIAADSQQSRQHVMKRSCAWSSHSTTRTARWRRSAARPGATERQFRS